jgi:hypothetical protein
MKIELNDNTVRLTESGIIKTEISDSYPTITDEFYPMCGNTIQTQIDNIIVQPNTYKKRVFDFKDKEYLKREIQDKNRTIYNIAKDFNTNESTIRPYVKKHNIENPLKDKEQLEELWEEHGSISDIAKDVNAETYEVKIALEQKNIIDPYGNNKAYS